MTSPAGTITRSVADWQELAQESRGPLQEIEILLQNKESEIQALMPEPRRLDRLEQELLATRTAEGRVADAPLSGVPVGIKDIFHVAGLPTTAGSRLPTEVLTGPEATSVGQLKEAGALILGKTVSTEFAYFAPGPTRNPWNADHTPGGSSSGSAAAVAAGYCPVALGTQTIGSISRPAAYCGVVGFKPSYGRISTAGVIPLSPSMDHVGVFATKVADAQSLAELLLTRWRPEPPGQRPVLGIPAGPFLARASQIAMTSFQDSCDRLVAADFEIRTVSTFHNIEQIEKHHQTIMTAEAAKVHAAWYRDYGDLYHEKTRQLIAAGDAVSGADLAAALAAREELQQGLLELMLQHQVDIWISPAARGPAPRGLGNTGDPCMNLPWTQAGLPTVTLPSAITPDGLPLGLQIAGGWQRDEWLLEWSREIETGLGEIR